DPPTIAEEGRDLEEQPDPGDGRDGADRSGRGPAPAQDEPEGDRRVVVLRAPRTPRGRHLPQGVRRRSRPMALLAALCLVATLAVGRSEEHTSELQSRFDLVCRLLLDKKNKY